MGLVEIPESILYLTKVVIENLMNFTCVPVRDKFYSLIDQNKNCKFTAKAHIYSHSKNCAALYINIEKKFLHPIYTKARCTRKLTKTILKVVSYPFRNKTILYAIDPRQQKLHARKSYNTTALGVQ